VSLPVSEDGIADQGHAIHCYIDLSEEMAHPTRFERVYLCLRKAYVFRGQGVDNAFVSFPNYWKHLFEDTPLCGAVPLGGWPRMFAFLKHWRDRRGQALADADALMAKYWS
jgi:hypothetical protein